MSFWSNNKLSAYLISDRDYGGNRRIDMSRKIGRNDKCYCGNGLKYKKCCLNKESNKLSKITSTKIFSQYPNHPEKKNYTLKVVDYKKGITYRLFENNKIEKVNPIEYFYNLELEKQVELLKDQYEIKNPDLVAQKPNEHFYALAKKEVGDNGYMEHIEKYKVPEKFIDLLSITRKKDQKALLKGSSITFNQFVTLVYISYLDYGYLFSRYIFETIPRDLADKKKPLIADLSDNDTKRIIGETDMTDGEVKRMIEQRKVIVAYFFDKEDVWSCFFYTFRSVDGKENWEGGKPHFHYYSSAFGVSREDFIKSMEEEGIYSSTPFHIKLIGYDPG